ncbi:hypothetical protein [Desulforhopalus sp. 52FAK]
MARGLDFYNDDNNVEWVEVDFPNTESELLPADTGVYRFVCHHIADKQTLFIEDTMTSSYGENVRSCYFHHSSVNTDPLAKLKELYNTQGLFFEHFLCDAEEAKKQRHLFVTRFRPHYNCIKFIIETNPINNPFEL